MKIAPVIVIVAIVAYANKSRLMFWFGLAGCFVGLFFDRGGSTGGLLDHASVRAGGFASLGIIGASLGCLFAWLMNKHGYPQKQFSIFELMAVTLMAAAILSLSKFAFS